MNNNTYNVFDLYFRFQYFTMMTGINLTLERKKERKKERERERKRDRVEKCRQYL